MRPETLEWVEKAEGDFQTAGREAAVAEAPNFSAVCFHAQQSAEKYLKALLVEHEVLFSQDSQLADARRAFASGKDRHRIDCRPLARLTPYGIDVRYPVGRPDANAAKEAMPDCATVRSLLRKLLGMLL